jgi:hypothetical protein
MTHICFQTARSPQAGEDTLEMMTRMMRTVARNDPTLSEDLRAHLDDVKVVHDNPVIYTMNIAGKTAIALHDLTPVLIHNEAKIEFISSDAPVVLFNQWAQQVKHRGVLGWASAGLQVFLPLSPRVLLLLYDRDVYSIEKTVLSKSSSVQALNALHVARPVKNIYFSGHAATLEAIKALPFEWIADASQAQKIAEADATDGSQSVLIHNFRRIVGKLAIPEIGIQMSAERTPVFDRGRRAREMARALAEMMVPESERSGPPTAQTFRPRKIPNDL